VDFVDNRIDPMTGTIRGRGVLANPGGYLVPGFFARVRIPGSGLYQATLVPDSAILTDQNQRVLYVVGANDSVEVRPVKLGALFGELRSIESGIDASVRVIVNGLMQARPGDKVNPRESSIPLNSLPPTPREPVPSGSRSPMGQQPASSDGSEP
jgi:multidrug efflux pump subunit AcrA (membrane-fusion protein)